MSHLVEQINEARRLVEELGGKQTKSLDDLKVELDRMVEESKKPGYSPDNAERLAQRQLVIDSMLTARHVLTDHFLDDTQSEQAPALAGQTPEVAQTPSAFDQPSETPKQAPKTEAPATGTQFERFMSGASSMASQGYEGFKGFMSSAGKNISEFFAYLGTSITTLWNSWFGKKETTTTPPTTPPVVTEVPAESVKAPNLATQAYEDNPPPANSETLPPYDEFPTSKPPQYDPLKGESVVENAKVVETVSLMDGKEHSIGGHRIVWTGDRDNLLSIDDKVFGVTTVTIGKILVGSPTLEKRGDTLVIRAKGKTIELSNDQVASLLNQALKGERTKEPAGLFSAAYDYVTVNLAYSTVSGEGAAATRTPGSRVIELLPK